MDKINFKINFRNIMLLLIEHLIWVLMVIVFLIFSLFVNNFFTLANIHYILYMASLLGLLVFAESISLLSGNMDLSISNNAGLSAMLIGVIMVEWLPILPGWAGIIIILVIGGSLGAFNGFFVGKLKINPFLVTLSTYLMFNWLTYFIRKGAIINVPPELIFLGGAKIGNIYIAIIVLISMSIFLYFILDHTRFGSYIRAVGGNSDAAGMLGIKTGKINFWVFTISGMLAGGAGLIYIGYLKTIPSTIAEGDVLFLAFAGSIIGGVSMNGGRGSIIGALGGIILIALIQAGCTMTSMDPTLRGFLNGLILLIAILINKTREVIRDKLLMSE
jgi:ribose/xylose/arabinose/galactoside ABC-type transport system permease subunit